ncbi:hypothetical protein YB2330_004020 [Saitoella coloradoensis]
MTDHRLPTLSLTQSLAKSLTPTTRLRTSSTALDEALDGGIPRGQITEVCGPPGSGKTTLGMQVAVGAVRAGGEVVWMVAGQPPPLTRLLDLISTSASSSDDDDEEPEAILRRIHMLHTPTLPSILSTFLHPLSSSASFPPPNTSLIIIDDLSTPVATSFPTGVDDPPHTPPPDAPHPKPKPGDKPESTPQKRARILASLGAGMARVAATQNTAILILSHMTSRIIRTPLSTSRGAVLVPYLGESWTGSLGVRITLFRNDIPTKLLTPAPTAAGMGDEDVGVGVRHAFISRSPSIVNSTQNKTVVFRITDSGLADLPLMECTGEVLDAAAAANTLKRKRERQMTEEGDYGWVEDEGCSQVLEGIEEEILATQREEAGDD